MSNTRPTICLNMIVRNEAHIVREVLDCVAKYIDYWVIVDTGSDDGTQDIIRAHTAELGIPGELHERTWQNFGVNRTQALDLAKGHADYIWVIDADDLVMGDLDLTNLTADAYEPRLGDSAGFSHWRAQILRDGLPGAISGGPRIRRLRSAIHARPPPRRLLCRFPAPRRPQSGSAEVCARPRSAAGRNGTRSQRLPVGASISPRAADLGDYANSKIWYARRAEMGGWDEGSTTPNCASASRWPDSMSLGPMFKTPT